MNDEAALFLRFTVEQLKSLISGLENYKELVAAQRAVRTTSPLLNIVPLYLYCNKATAGRATDQEIVDLINAARCGEELPVSSLLSVRALKIQVDRARKRSPKDFAFLEKWIEQYVESPHHKQVTFGVWLKQMRLSGNLQMEVAN